MSGQAVGPTGYAMAGRGELRYGEFEHLRRPSAVIPGQSRGALARNLLRLYCADAVGFGMGLTRKESLLRKPRSYKMSYLDIVMAGGVMLLAVLMILRKKSR
jgi:hypothetical protein